jgi:hypothetical protein
MGQNHTPIAGLRGRSPPLSKIVAIANIEKIGLTTKFFSSLLGVEYLPARL